MREIERERDRQTDTDRDTRTKKKIIKITETEEDREREGKEVMSYLVVNDDSFNDGLVKHLLVPVLEALGFGDLHVWGWQWKM